MTHQKQVIQSSRRALARTHKGKRAFTLVELMVAMTGGLFVTVFVFMLTRDVSRFFQGQAKLSEATLGAVTGFERLRSDIARAGFLASPNLAKDVNLCPRPASGAATVPPYSSFAGLQDMGLARIIRGDDTGIGTRARVGTNFMLAAGNNTTAGIRPDRIVLYGNYTTSEQFPLKLVNTGANTVTLEMRDSADQLRSAALGRVGISGLPANAAADFDILERIFPVASIVRVVDVTGREQYGIVTAPQLTADPDGDPILHLDPLAPLINKSAGGTCGFAGGGAESMVNPVSIFRYELQNLNAVPAYANLFAGDGPTYDAERLELVRVPVNADGTDDTANTELIAELATDLKFGLTVETNPTLGTQEYLGEDHIDLLDFADIPHTAATSGQAGNFGPHLIRGIHVRLGIRTREADREAGVLDAAAMATATAEDLFRVQVAAGKFARVRSLRSHVATRNTLNSRYN